MRMLILCVLATACGGCQIAGLSALYGSRDKAHDERLVGIWERVDAGADPATVALATIRPAANGSYSLVVSAEPQLRPEDGPFELQATLVRLGKGDYFDVEAPPEALAASLGPYSLFVLPIHYYYRVEIGEERLTAATMDFHWLNELLKNDPDAAMCVRPCSDPLAPGDPERPGFYFEPPAVLTGSTATVQQFIARHGDDPKAWSTTDWYRKYQSLLPDEPGEQ